MRQPFAALLLLMLVAACPALAQKTGVVSGVCNDKEGNPIVGAVVEWQNTESGRKYAMKTNRKGEYFSLGIVPGQYNVTLLQDNKELFHFNGVVVSVGDNLDAGLLNFDLKKEQAAAAGATGQVKQQDEAARVAKEIAIVRTLNEKLSAAAAASKAGDFDAAIRILNEATQLDSTRDLIWFKLGESYSLSAAKLADGTERTKLLNSAIANYQKAIEIKRTAVENETIQKPDANKQLAAYYNDQCVAYGRLGNAESAKNACMQAARFDAENAGKYYFNLGAILANADQDRAAVTAFKLVPASSAQFDKAQEQIEIIQQSPPFRSIGPQIQSPAFKSAIGTCIQSAKSQFKNLKGRELAHLDNFVQSESSLTLPGALACNVLKAHEAALICSFATSHRKDALRPEYDQLVSSVRAAVPANWESLELDPEKNQEVAEIQGRLNLNDDSPGYRFSGPEITIWVMIHRAKGYYELKSSIVSFPGSAANVK